VKKREINKEIVLKSLAKMINDKESVLSYIKGKITINALTKRGVKLAEPL
jgi:hypothetical protein